MTRFSLLVACLSAWASAQSLTPEDLVNQAHLPPAYSGNAMQTVEGPPAGRPPTVNEFAFAIAEEWTTGTQFHVDPSFGRSPIIYEYGTNDESYYYSFGPGPQIQVFRTSRFRDSGMMAIEQGVSPLPIIRFLRTHHLDRAQWKVRAEEGTTVLDLRTATPGPMQKLFFENDSHRLVRKQVISAKGNVAAETLYQDWKPIGTDFEAPTKIIETLDDGDERTTLTTVLSDLKSLDPDHPPARKPIPPDATIIDVATGVTTTADGTVLGKLEQSSPAVPPTGPRTGLFRLNARTVMLVGVALLLLAGIVVVWRRWRSV